MEVARGFGLLANAKKCMLANRFSLIIRESLGPFNDNKACLLIDLN